MPRGIDGILALPRRYSAALWRFQIKGWIPRWAAFKWASNHIFPSKFSSGFRSMVWSCSPPKQWFASGRAFPAHRNRHYTGRLVYQSVKNRWAKAFTKPSRYAGGGFSFRIMRFCFLRSTLFSNCQRPIAPGMDQQFENQEACMVLINRPCAFPGEKRGRRAGPAKVEKKRLTTKVTKGFHGGAITV